MLAKFGIVAAILAFSISAAAQMSIPGEVVEVIDGRTVVVALPTGKVTVELQYIEVPDQGQQLHDTVADHLRGLVKGKMVEYRPRTIFNQRTIGRLTLGDVDVSQQMLRDGAAWHIPQQVSGQERSEFDSYSATEATAKTEKRGVWSIPGLKPAWEVRAEKDAIADRLENDRSAAFGRRLSSTGRSGPSTGANPALGNIGALINQYDPESKTGYVGTPVVELDNRGLAGERLAIGVTYYYKEDDRKSRKGSFVLTVVCMSNKPRLLTNNDLFVISDGSITNLGKPKRTVVKDGDIVRESLFYALSRKALETIANNETYLKIGDHVIQPTGARYLLYTMLQITQ